MITVRQIERNWSQQQYRRLCGDLLASRPEAGWNLELEDVRVVAAALAVIRLDEIGQAHAPFYGRMLHAVLAAQQADGGWGDLVTTSLCLRALLLGGGRGVAIEGGLAFLANLQQPRGIWPKIPLRRMPADAFTSAFVVYQLGDQAAFQTAVRLDEAMIWFEAHAAEIDADARRLWDRAMARCRLTSACLVDILPMAEAGMDQALFASKNV